MPYTREQIERHLEVWEAANIAVSQGQKYQIGTRSLTRVNATEILNQIKYWKNELDKLDALEFHKSRNRLYRIVPRD